jgi:hypothetical protein
MSMVLQFLIKKHQDVLDVPQPILQQDLKSFLGLVNYFRDHVRNHSELVQPLHHMISPYKPRNKLKWDDNLLKIFYDVQERVNTAPPLYFLDYNAPVYLHTDASNFGIGSYLFQEKDGKELPIAFISKTLNPTEIKWSTTEKECYAIFYSLVKLEYLLRDIKFTLRTDHRNLTFLNDSFQPKVKRWKLAIQHFNFDIEHIPGEKNVCADALSRLIKIPHQHMFNKWDHDDESNREHNTEHMFLITEESLHDIAYFRLENDTYKKLAKVHNSTIGHLGVEKMLTKLKRGGEGWKGMRIDCKKFIYQCSCCQKMSALKYPIHVHPYTKASYTPMDRIAIDTIGPLPVDALGNKYIITIIDCFSRIVELVPAQDTTAITAANAILQWICRYGIPSQIVSDNGTQYSNELVTKLCQLFEIDQSLIQAYSHEENAIVERANKEVGRHLRAIVHDRKILDDWSPMLPLVQRIMNSQIHESIGVSPLQLMYGNSLDMDRLLVMPTAQVQEELDAVNQLNDLRYADWTKKLISQQSNLLKVAMETQLDSDLYHIQRHTNLNKDEITEFPINSYVLQRYEADGHRQPNKLKTPLRGPHKVIGKHTRNDGPDVYTVQNLTNNKLEDFKVNNL